MEGFIVVLFFLLGIVGGSAVTVFVLCLTSIGNLRIDTSDPDGPFLFLELNQKQSIDKLSRETFVMLKVNMASYISRK